MVDMGGCVGGGDGGGGSGWLVSVPTSAQAWIIMLTQLCAPPRENRNGRPNILQPTVIGH